MAKIYTSPASPIAADFASSSKHTNGIRSHTPPLSLSTQYLSPFSSPIASTSATLASPTLSPRLTATLGPPPSTTYTFAYYCSPHGFGHATRVLAVSQWLTARGHSVVVATTAPQHLFASLLLQPGSQASYRTTHIAHASIVQPTAYTLSRRQTLQKLAEFMEEGNRRTLIEEETKWLTEAGVDCVLADAPGLPCTAATAAGLPSVLITNFTFDSCYSYLTAPSPSLASGNGDEDPSLDPPLSREELQPLVDRCVADYANASLILRLPGFIPFPAFDGLRLSPETGEPILPEASEWVDIEQGCFKPLIETSILSNVQPLPPSSSSTSTSINKRIIPVPLIVRPLSPHVYTPSFRSNLLDSIGVPAHLHDPAKTKILVVSFGGQAIPRPADGVRLLPPGWIAIVCGGTAPAAPSRSGSGFVTPADAEGEKRELPEGFYACPGRDVYVPDLTAHCDVVLGKLGYGTCSETLSTKTPFIYVPRPLFVEEYGLKRLMRQRGVCVEMDRRSFESGRWTDFVEEAWKRGHEAKERERDGRDASGEVQGADGDEKEEAGKVIVQELEKYMAEWELEEIGRRLKVLR